MADFAKSFISMCGQVDDDFTVYIEPLGMMIHFLRLNGCAGHEAERFHEISKLEFSVQLFVDQGPAWQFIQPSVDRVIVEFLAHQ